MAKRRNRRKKDTPLAALKGKQLGGYTILEHLDSGGMAEIFVARNDGPGGFRKELVVKLLAPRYAANDMVVAMFRDEARIAAKLNHPNIVDVFDVGEASGQHFIAMEHIEGRTLTELVQRGLEVGKPVPLPLATLICAEVAEGLSYMWDGTDRGGKRHAVIHRDISPTNIIISDRGHTKILDFGIATDHGDSKEEEARPGKYAYMSPEQITAKPLDGRSDVFSLGIILYEITLGRRLYRGKQEEVMRWIVEDRVRPPTFVDPEYPPALELIVLRALEKRPEDRYQNAGEMRADLQAFLSEFAPGTAPLHLADYIADIESDEAEVSELGARRAAAFAGEDDDPDALDFDKGPAPVWAVAGPEPVRRTPVPDVPRAAATEPESGRDAFKTPPGAAPIEARSPAAATAGQGHLVPLLLAVAMGSAAVTWLLLH